MAKVVLITGASSGIGKGIALYLHSKNYTVYGTSRNPDKIEVPFKMVTLDLLDVNSIQKAVAEVIAKEGELDVLINNAGIGIMGPVEDTPTDEMRKGFDTNLFGPLEVIKTVLPQMRKQQSGLVINVTSLAGYSGLPFRGAYSASKSAFEIITESLNMEVKNFGIDVVAVAPGSFATNVAERRYYTPVLEKSAYKEVYSKNLQVTDEYVDGGLNPMVMAKAVEKIINAKNRKVHYKVAVFMEKFSVVLKRILPDTWYRKLIMNHYRLNEKG